MGFSDIFKAKQATHTTETIIKSVSNPTWQTTGFQIGAFSDSAYLDELQKIAEYNTYLASSIRKILQNSIIPWLKVWNSRTGEYVDHPSLMMLENPNPLQSYEDFLQYVLFNYLWDGNAYILKLKTGNTITGLMPINSNNVTPEIVANQIRYQYRLNGKATTYTRDDIIHWKDSTFGASYLKGTSVIKHALFSIINNSYADRFNASLMQKGGELKGVLSSEQTLTKEDINLMSSEWDNRFGGADSAGKTAILGKGLKYQQTGANPKDMGYSALKTMGKGEIFSLLGVPPVVLGYTESVNYANAKEQTKIFWENTIKPLLASMAGKLSKELLADRTLRFEYDYSMVSALKSDLTETLNQAYNAVAIGYSLQSVTEALEIPFDIDSIETTPTTGTTEPIETDEQKRYRLKAEKAFEDYLGNQWLKAHGKVERKFQNDIEKYFVRQRNYIRDLSRSEAKATTELYVYIDKVLKYINDEKLDREIEQIGEDNFENIKRNLVMTQLAEFDIAFKESAKMTQVIVNHSLRMVTPQNTVRSEVLDLTEQATRENWTVQELAQQIDGKYQNAKVRALTIARTEIGSIANEMLDEQYKAEGFTRKKWIATSDGETRKSHWDQRNKTIPISDTYPNGLKYPGDPNGTADEIINCRCTLAPVP
jgi:HK97 family phage portal protein